MTVRLRGHHLLCVLTYVGKGYTPAFTANLDRIAGRLSEGEEVLLVDGPDDICAPMAFACGAHCPSDDIRLRDSEALAAVGRTLGRALQVGGRLCLTPAVVAGMRAAFAGARAGEAGLRRACGGCEWSSLCTDIAGGGYPGVRLRMR
ncbi:DUF1284 domain-containing protein [Pseudochelatococcus sp. B33]